MQISPRYEVLNKLRMKVATHQFKIHKTGSNNLISQAISGLKFAFGEFDYRTCVRISLS